MEKKTIRSGAPFVFAGVGVLAVALTAGIGTISSYLIAAGVGCAAFALGKKKYPDRVVEVETAPKSGNAEVDALIREARGQLDQIAAATTRLPDPALSRQIEDIETTCRQILQRLEEQPNMLSQLRTFLRYYLPATLKLLNARAALEAEVNAGGSRRSPLASPKPSARCSPPSTSSWTRSTSSASSIWKAKWTCWRTCSNPTA